MNKEQKQLVMDTIHHFDNPGQSKHYAALKFHAATKDLPPEDVITLVTDTRGIQRTGAKKYIARLYKLAVRYNPIFGGFSKGKMDYVFGFTDHKKKILFSNTDGKPKLFSVWRWNPKLRVHEKKAMTVFDMRTYEFERVFTSKGLRLDLDRQKVAMVKYRTERLNASVDDHRIVLDKGGKYSHSDLLDLLEGIHQYADDDLKAKLKVGLQTTLNNLN